MTFTKKIDRARQWAGEKMGGEARTSQSDEFQMLEAEMGMRQAGKSTAYTIPRVAACPRLTTSNRHGESPEISQRLCQMGLASVRWLRGQESLHPHYSRRQLHVCPRQRVGGQLRVWQLSFPRRPRQRAHRRYPQQLRRRCLCELAAASREERNYDEGVSGMSHRFPCSSPITR